MNNKSFRRNEVLLYIIPALVVDLAIHIGTFEFVLSKFIFWDKSDLVLARPRTLYFLVVGYLLASALYKTNLFKWNVRIVKIVSNTFLQTLITLSILAISVFVLFDSFAGRFYFQEGIMASLLLTVWHLCLRKIILKLRKVSGNRVQSIIVGNGSNTLDLYNGLASDGDFRLLGMFADENPGKVNYLGKVADVEGYLKSNEVHTVFCGLNPAVRREEVNAMIRLCENNFMDFFYVPNMDGYLHRKMSFRNIDGVLVFNLRDEPLDNFVNIALKRAFDIVISGLFLVTLFPIIFIFVAFGTTISSPGPIFFKQKRTGYKGKPFTILKFRSMKVNVDADKVQATKDDPRKTKFGDFLRRTSIDELPQFINVFIGDMSVIGPRPHMELHTEMYNKIIDEYMVRHMVKPGVTGWAQVNGFRGETRTPDQMEGRVRSDIWYIENWSIWLDIKIFFMTVFQVARKDEQAY